MIYNSVSEISTMNLEISCITNYFCAPEGKIIKHEKKY